jgi:uncharacterized protein
MGHVGGLVAEFLVEHLKLRSFAEIVLFDKPFVLCRDGLISEIPSTYKLYYSDKANMVLMSGNSQPQNSVDLYELCNNVLDIASEVGSIERVYTCGGYHREEIRGEPKVFGVSNNPELFKELDKLGIREIGSEVSSITWFNGVILGVAKRRRIDGVGLYGELTDPDVPQPTASRVVLKALTTLLSLPQLRDGRENESKG